MPRKSNHLRRYGRRAVKKAARTVSPITYIIPLCLLAVGLLLGYFGAGALAVGSDFALLGEKSFTLTAGEMYTYTDEGLVFTYFGTDYSGAVDITTNFPTAENGMFSVTPEAGEVYYIAYTSTHALFFSGVRLVRTFVCEGGVE